MRAEFVHRTQCLGRSPFDLAVDLDARRPYLPTVAKHHDLLVRTANLDEYQAGRCLLRVVIVQSSITEFATNEIFRKLWLWLGSIFMSTSTIPYRSLWFSRSSKTNFHMCEGVIEFLSEAQRSPIVKKDFERSPICNPAND